MSALAVIKMEADAQAINRRHREIVETAQAAFVQAMEMGRHLSYVKAKLKHGEWLPWVSSNLEFSERTVRRYLALHENRLLLKSANVTDLNDAYTVISKTGRIKTKGISVSKAAELLDVPVEMAEAARFLIKVAPYYVSEIDEEKITIEQALRQFIDAESGPAMLRLWAVSSPEVRIAFLDSIRKEPA